MKKKYPNKQTIHFEFVEQFGKIRNSGFGNSWKHVMNSLNVMKKKKCIAVISIINEWIQLLYTTYYIHAKNYYTTTYIHIRHNIGKKYEKRNIENCFKSKVQFQGS